MLTMTLSHRPRGSTLSPQAWAVINKAVVLVFGLAALWLDATKGLTALGVAAAAFLIGQLNGRNQANELRSADYETVVQLEARRAGISLGTGDYRERVLRKELSTAFSVHQLPPAAPGEGEADGRDG